MELSVYTAYSHTNKLIFRVVGYTHCSAKILMRTELSETFRHKNIFADPRLSLFFHFTEQETGL
jgi:hypothetical protein